MFSSWHSKSNFMLDQKKRFLVKYLGSFDQTSPTPPWMGLIFGSAFEKLIQAQFWLLFLAALLSSILPQVSAVHQQGNITGYVPVLDEANCIALDDTLSPIQASENI